MTRPGLVLSLACAASVVGASASAAPPENPASFVRVVAAPVFGAEAATGTGWGEVVARVENVGTVPQEGVLEVSMTQSWSSGEPEIAARAPFAVAGGQSAVLSIPTHGFSWYAPQMTLIAKALDGREIQTVAIPCTGSTAPLLVEVEEPARLSHALRGWPLDAKWVLGPTRGDHDGLTTGAPAFDRTTGDPLLPQHATGYEAATVVLLRSSRLLSLDEPHRAALVEWVNAGGVLAVVPSRPEDLRAPALASLLGGDAEILAPPPRLLLLPAVLKPELGALEEDAPVSGKPGPAGAHPKGGETRVLAIGPPTTLRDHLVGFGGGLLRESDFGAWAPYGLGEVHLLAFDPMTPATASDPWVDSRMIELTTRAWDRRSRVTLPLGGGDRTGSLDGVRHALDPHENFRLALGVSALLLILYAIVVGPMVFARASKTARPLAPLVWVPLCSAVAFTAIVLVGSVEKGWKGRVRHLTLLEAGSSASRASCRSYRSFFASDIHALSVPPLHHGGALEVIAAESVRSHTVQGVLRVGGDGMTLGELASLPWETVVVREDAMADLGSGVALVPSKAGLDVVNGTGTSLKDVVVRAGRDGAWFPLIAAGERVSVSAGRPVFGLGTLRTTAGTLPVHPLGTSGLPIALGPEGKRVAEAWAPFEAAAGDTVDWWPDATPVLLAEVIPSARARDDSGLALESERVFLRVVGSTLEPTP